jgi:hypothetical protein
MNKVLTTSPTEMLSLSSPDTQLVAGKCGRQTEPQIDFLLLECDKREAYNFVQWLDREVKEEKVEEVTVRKMLRKLMDGRMTNYPLRWSWTSRNFC